MGILSKLLGPVGNLISLLIPTKLDAAEAPPETTIAATIEATQKKLNISLNDAQKVVAGAIYKVTEEKGIDPNDLYANMPASLQDAIKLTPEALKQSQNLTIISVAGAALASLGTIIGGVIAKNPKVTLLGGAGLLAVITQLANNLNDVFVHGENYKQSTALELFNIEQKGKDLGVTSFGDFNTNELDGLLAGYLRAGAKGFIDIKTREQLPLTAAGIRSAVTTIISDFNASGVGPTKDKVLATLRGWAIGPNSKLLQTDSTTSGAGAAGGTTGGARTRQTVSSAATPKIFTGVVYAGTVTDRKDFIRQVDDAITDDADLSNDVITNLTGWILNLAGRINFDIVSALNPKDENGIPKQGPWLVLNIYLTNTVFKRLLVETILLGPYEPTKYMPNPRVTQQLQLDIPGLLKPEQIKPLSFPGGGVMTFDDKGTPVFVLGSATGSTTQPSAATAPASQIVAPTSSQAGATAPAPVAAQTPEQVKIAVLTNTLIAAGQSPEAAKASATAAVLPPSAPPPPEPAFVFVSGGSSLTTAKQKAAFDKIGGPPSLYYLKMLPGNAKWKTAATLAEYYDPAQANLPSRAERGLMYQRFFSGNENDYFGTAIQNTNLLAALKNFAQALIP